MRGGTLSIIKSSGLLEIAFGGLYEFEHYDIPNFHESGFFGG